MRSIFVVISFLVLLWSCSTDVPAPCADGSGSIDHPCREYLSVNETPQGFLEFFFSGDSLVETDHYNARSEWVATRTEQIRNGRTEVVTQRQANGPTIVSTYHYNEHDSLAAIFHGSVDSTVRYEYGPFGKTLEQIFHQETLVRQRSFRYYEDNGELYRIYELNPSDSVLRYRHFEYFSTGQTRISEFTGANELIGRHVRNFSASGQLLWSTFTDSTGTERQRTDITYDDLGRAMEKSVRSIWQTRSSRYAYQ